jgi:hypothetical protein
MLRIKRHLFFVIIFLVGIIGLVAVYSKPLIYPPIRSDGVGYYLYLPAVFIYHDISLQSIAESHFKGHIPENAGAALWKDTGNYLIKFPIGEAVLMTPFFLVAWIFSLISSLFSATRYDAFSHPFQYMAAVSGLFYAAAGLSILRGILQKYFRRNTVLLVLIGLLFGTDLFHYATCDSVFSHAYSFFLFVVFLYFVEQIYTQRSVRYFLGAGAVAGLILVTRPTNILWLVFGVFYAVRSVHDLGDRYRFLLGHARQCLLALLPFFGFVALQLLYWKAITGSFVVYSYGSERFCFAHPHIADVLFSVRKGLFFWAPILLTVFPGLWYARTKAPGYFVPILIFFPLNVYIVASWESWWYGGSFGHRAFVESMPLFAICLCSLYEGIRSVAGKRVLLSAMAVCMLLSTWLMVSYWFGMIPYENPAWKDIINALMVLK